MKFKNKAFTLAETLVVMGIIGVIAALTIPNLSQSTGNREKVVKIKKAYAQLSEALDRAQAVYGPIDEWFTSDMSAAVQAERYGDRVTEFMKLSKNCRHATGCYKYTGYDSDSNIYKIVLADGTSVHFNSFEKFIGVNISPKRTSKLDFNKEEFTFTARNGKVEPWCDDADLKYQFLKNNNKQFDCAAKWIINYDNMDYTKVGWSDKKCPNGTVLNLTANPPVTSCN